MGRREVLGGSGWLLGAALGMHRAQGKGGMLLFSTGDPSFAGFWSFGEISFISIYFKEQFL